MDRLKVREKPEKDIQLKIEAMLRSKEWFVKRTHGNAFSDGWPDIFASHYRYGMRWIEVKLPGMKGSVFTAAQLRTFPQMDANGAKIWILTAATEHEYQKLFGASNLLEYLIA